MLRDCRKIVCYISGNFQIPQPMRGGGIVAGRRFRKCLKIGKDRKKEVRFFLQAKR